MRIASALIVVLLAACGGSSRPAPAEPAPTAEVAPAPAPPAAPAGTVEEVALAFVGAVVRRDRAAIEPMLMGRDACEQMVAQAEDAPAGAVDQCAAELEEANALGLAEYEKAIPATFEVGATETMTLDKDEQVEIVIVTVHPREGTAGEPIAVFVFTAMGHRYVSFPMKKQEP